MNRCYDNPQPPNGIGWVGSTQINSTPMNRATLSDTKMRFVIKHYYFYENSTLYNGASYTNDMDKIDYHLNKNPEAINQLNWYIAKKICHSTALGYSNFTYHNGGRTIFVSTGVGVDGYSNWTTSEYFLFENHLSHELGHQLDLWHTYNTEPLDPNDERFLDDVFPNPPVYFNGDNVMGGRVPNDFVSPKQMGRIHKHLALTDNRNFAYGYSYIPHEITSNEEWDFVFKSYNDIVIKNGATLTLTCRLEMVPQSKILIETGGKLIIDGGIITSARCGGIEHEGYWQGIQVQGNHSLSQYPVANQGVVEIINDGTIENAKIGINAYQDITIPLFGSSITYSLGGGIIRANNANFKNNEIDIKMAPYRYLNSFNQRPVNQASYITRSNFVTNNDLPTTAASIIHINLLGIYGLQIKGCSFTNTNSSLTTIEKGIAINSVISSLKVIPYCDPQNPTCVDEPNEFTNLHYGIKCTEEIGSLNTVNINENEFNNVYRAIFLSGTNNAQILLNNIQVPDLAITQAGHPDPGAPYGIYLNGGKGFRVEENTLWRPSSNGPEVFNGARGIIVHKTGAVDNEIYKNTFTNLFLSQQGQCYNSGTDLPPWYGQNNPGADVGLKFFCNTSQTSSSSYDMWMGGQNYCSPNISSVVGSQRFGIAKVQGRANPDYPASSNDEFLPAGNRFSDSHLNLPTTATVDFDNGEAAWLEYWWDDLDGNGPDGWEPLRSENIYNYPRPVTFNVCPTKISGGGTSLSTLYTNLTGAQAALNSSITMLNIWQNGGDYDLGEEVATTEPWDVYQQFNDLLATSPYLDEAVLIEVIQNQGFTSLMVKLLMIANPHAVNSEAVMFELENRNPAMPQSYIDEIRSQPESISQLQILKGNVAANNHLMSMISEEIKATYRADNDNGWAKDSLINFVSRRPGLSDKYELATIYLSYGQYTDMQNLLVNIESNFDMDETMEADFNDFETLLNMAKTMDQNMLYEGGLSETEVTALEAILGNDQPLTASLALSLLKRNNPQYAYSEPVYDVTQSSPRMAHPFTPEALESGVVPEFKIYPNPAIDYTTLKYNCKYYNLAYTIVDVTGKSIKTTELKTIENVSFNEELIDLSGICSGTYYFVVKTNSEVLFSEKLILTE